MQKVATENRIHMLRLQEDFSKLGAKLTCEPETAEELKALQELYDECKPTIDKWTAEINGEVNGRVSWLHTWTFEHRTSDIILYTNVRARDHVHLDHRHGYE